MKTKFFILFALLLAYAFKLNAQQPFNPFKSIGKEATVLTLSEGKYEEFFDTDTIAIVGSAVLNIKTMKVIGFIISDTAYSEATLEPEIVSRWLSIDPLARKYPQLSPYNFVGNMPIIAIDPDGRKILFVNEKSKDQFFKAISSTLGNEVAQKLYTVWGEHSVGIKTSQNEFNKLLNKHLKTIDDKEVRDKIKSDALGLYEATTSENDNFVEVINPTQVTMQDDGLSIDRSQTGNFIEALPTGDTYRVTTGVEGKDQEVFDISTFDRNQQTNTFVKPEENKGLIISSGRQRDLSTSESQGLIDGVINTDKNLSGNDED